MDRDTVTRHTPGPWRDRIATGVPDHMISGGYDKRQRNGESICVIPFRYGEGEGTARRNANARLIALAPEMADALRKFVEIADGKALHRGLEDEARALLARLEEK